MPTVKFLKEKQSIEVPQGANLRTEAIKAGIGVYRGRHKLINCRGLGSCGTCRVLIKKGIENTSNMGTKEKLRFLLSPSNINAGHEDEMRLSCQVTVNGDIEVETQPPLLITGEKFWE